jgi:hypothetical protein
VACQGRIRSDGDPIDGNASSEREENTMHMTPMTHPTRRYAIVGLVLLGIGLLPALVAAESGRAVGVVLDEERRSVIQ